MIYRNILRTILITIICDGNVLISSNLFAPKYCAIIADIAERV